MANKYYYLAASLPSLKFGGKPPITKGAFLYECEKWLTPGDLAKIKGSSDSAVIREWKAFDSSFRERLAALRREKSRKDILAEPDPLSMEKRFERVRWDFLEEKERCYYFDMNVLELYFLKLQILERLSSFDKEKGKAAFEKVCEAGQRDE